MNDKYQEICRAAEQVATKAGAYILAQQGQVDAADIDEKEQNSLVSYVDKNAEKIITEGLYNILPEAGFITEEDVTENNAREFTWIIDPLDGTTNFLKSVPYFSVSIALAHHGIPVAGIVYDITSHSLFSASKGMGARCNGEKIRVTSSDIFSDQLIGTGFPYVSDHLSEAHIDVLRGILQSTRGIRRIGSAALDLCYVACGRFGAFYETHLNPWDVAAGGLIVQEAGGIMDDFFGNGNWLSGHTVLAVPPQFEDVMISRLEKFKGLQFEY